MFKSPFSFSGRIRRSEYCISYAIYLFAMFAVQYLAKITEGNQNFILLILGIVIYIGSIYFLIAQGAKRCHDRNNSGWYQLIPFYGLWMLFADGDDYENEYGPDPKGHDCFA